MTTAIPLVRERQLLEEATAAIKTAAQSLITVRDATPPGSAKDSVILALSQLQAAGVEIRRTGLRLTISARTTQRDDVDAEIAALNADLSALPAPV